MVALLVALALAQATQLKNTAVTRHLDSEGCSPIIIYFYTPDSSRCRAFHAIWNTFAEELGSKRVAVGNVNCAQEPELCARFKLDDLPAVYWHDAARKSCVSHEGSLTLFELHRFHESRASFPFWYIESEGDVRAISVNARLSPILIFWITQDADLDIPRKILEQNRHLDFTAAVVRRAQRNVLAIRDFDVQYVFPRHLSWCEKSLRGFIEMSLIPTTVTLTEDWFDRASRTGKLICIV